MIIPWQKITLWGGLSSAVIITGMGLYIWGLHATIDSLRQDVKFTKGERDFAIEQYTQCLSDQRLTKEVADEYQGKVSDLNAELARIKRLRNGDPSCVPITFPASGDHAAP